MAYGKDMSKVYVKMDTLSLRMLRAKKIARLRKAEEYNTYWAKKDRGLLSHQIMQIDAVLESREKQLRLL